MYFLSLSRAYSRYYRLIALFQNSRINYPQLDARYFNNSAKSTSADRNTRHDYPRVFKNYRAIVYLQYTSLYICIYIRVCTHTHAAHNRIQISRIINAFSRHSASHFRTLHRSVLTSCRKVALARMHINKDPGIFPRDTWTRYVVRALFRFRSFLRSFFNANELRRRAL